MADSESRVVVIGGRATARKERYHGPSGLSKTITLWECIFLSLQVPSELSLSKFILDGVPFFHHPQWKFRQPAKSCHHASPLSGGRRLIHASIQAQLVEGTLSLAGVTRVFKNV